MEIIVNGRLFGNLAIAFQVNTTIKEIKEYLERQMITYFDFPTFKELQRANAVKILHTEASSIEYLDFVFGKANKEQLKWFKAIYNSIKIERKQTKE